MTSRKIDKDGNWLMFQNLSTNFINDVEELKQNIITSIRCWLGDDFMNLNYGIDYINYLGSFGYEEELKQNIIKVVKNQYGVLSIINVDMFLDNQRVLNINLDLETIYGNINIKERVI